MKLTTICDVNHVISYTRPSSPLFFSAWGHREEGLGMRLQSRMTSQWNICNRNTMFNVQLTGSKSALKSVVR